MRISTRASILTLAASGLLFGCSTKKNGGLVVAVQTDVALPKDIDGVRMQVYVNGQQRLDSAVTFAKDLRIPVTLSLVPSDDDPSPVTIKVVGQKGNSSLVLREATTTVPTDRVGLLKMPLHWVCYGSAKDLEGDLPTETHRIAETACPSGETCIGGTCTVASVEEAKLPDYDGALVFGGSAIDGVGACFDTVQVFESAHAVTPDDTCSFASDAEPDSINVAVRTDTVGMCNESGCFIPLDRDGEGGWHAENGKIHVAPGVCKKVAAFKGASLVFVADFTNKTDALPTCGPWTDLGSGTPPSQPAQGGAAGEGGGAGKGGAGGKSGNAGASGAAGTSGEAGSAGASAMGGTAGSSGTGGTAGSSGTGGAAGSAALAVYGCPSTDVPRRLAVGDTHACVARDDGTVWCWGGNDLGELGDGSLTSVEAPESIASLAGVYELSAGATHTCALNAACVVSCWGDNHDDQLGYAASSPVSIPGVLPGLGDVASIESVAEYSLAVTQDGKLYGWGTSAFLFSSTVVSTPTEIPGFPAPVVEARAGNNHACALLASGEVACLGANTWADLGDGTTKDTTTPVMVSGLTDATHVVVGDRFSCALRADQTVVCWGDNAFDELGTGSGNGGSTVPVAPMLSGAVAGLAAGANHACALMADGSVACWGANEYGQLGDGAAGVESATPTAVLGLSGVVEIAARGYKTCARTADGSVSCWGDLSFPRYAPVTVTQAAVQSVTTGKGYTCTIGIDDDLSCWGVNDVGQLGTDPKTSPFVPFESAVHVAGSYSSVSAGENGTCAVNSDFSAVCWGCAAPGLATDDCTATPTVVGSIKGAVQKVATSGDHSCAVDDAGDLYCWGNNASGQCGDTSGVDFEQQPFAITSLPNVTDVAVGQSHTCAVVAESGFTQLYCWGDNNAGQLGDISPAQGHSNPAPLSLINPQRVVANGDSTCALLGNSLVYCWGSVNNAASPQEIDLVASSLAPDQVALGAGAVCVHSLKNDVVKCAGDNSIGLLGAGSVYPQSVDFATGSLVALSGSGNWRSLSLSTTHACVVALPDGPSSLECWGSDAYGQSSGSAKSPGYAPVVELPAAK